MLLLVFVSCFNKIIDKIKFMEMVENIKIGKKKLMPIVAWFVIGMLVGAGTFYSWNKYVVKSSVDVASQMEQAQVKELVAKVGKLIVLPTGEDPVVNVINDAAALIKDQVFYKGAQNGDVILVYQKALKAILYSPERNIIVNVGPIYVEDQATTTTAKK